MEATSRERWQFQEEDKSITKSVLEVPRETYKRAIPRERAEGPRKT